MRKCLDLTAKVDLLLPRIGAQKSLERREFAPVKDCTGFMRRCGTRPGSTGLSRSCERRIGPRPRARWSVSFAIFRECFWIPADHSAAGGLCGADHRSGQHRATPLAGRYSRSASDSRDQLASGVSAGPGAPGAATFAPPWGNPCCLCVLSAEERARSGAIRLSLSVRRTR